MQRSNLKFGILVPWGVQVSIKRGFSEITIEKEKERDFTYQQSMVTELRAKNCLVIFFLVSHCIQQTEEQAEGTWEPNVEKLRSH